MNYSTLVSTLLQDRKETEANAIVIGFLTKKTANVSDATYHDLDEMKWTQLANVFHEQMLAGKTKSDIYNTSGPVVESIFGEKNNITYDFKIYVAEQIVMNGVAQTQQFAKDILGHIDLEQIKQDAKKEMAEIVTNAATAFSGLRASMNKFRDSLNRPKNNDDKNNKM